MLIIGCDFHTRYQQIAMAREETGELLVERRLDHASGEAHAFYRSLQSSQEPVRVGIEATGPIHWFERLLADLGYELWIGDSAKIRASEVRKQKTDERDAALILDLLLAKRFPRIWVPTPAQRDLRQLLWHRHKLVSMRTMLGNQLHALALGQPAARRTSEAARPTRASHRGIGSRCFGRSKTPRRCSATDDSSRHRSGHRPGLRAGHRPDYSLSPQQEDRELSGTESQRGVQRRTAAARSHQQTRQYHGALAAHRNSASRRAAGSRTATGLSAFEIP